MNYFKTHKLQVSFIVFLLFLLFGWQTQVLSQGTIIDHTCTDITIIPESAINQAKAMLHIGYGHTSHGSQLTTGMTGLITFANNGGLGFRILKIFLNGIMEGSMVHSIWKKVMAMVPVGWIMIVVTILHG